MQEIINEKKILIGVALLAIVVFTSLGKAVFNDKKTTIKQMAQASVTIIGEHPVGTGVILSSSDQVSRILTNNHICGAILKGGKVISDSGEEYQVLSFQRSIMHDLCLVKVASDLKVNTELATSPPDLYEEAAIAGHPALYPSIITRGHFSKKLIIKVMIGMKACTPEMIDDAQKRNDPNLIITCLSLHGVPVTQSYESQLVSGTIMGGSSGSAVYNSKGELTNLVFAVNNDKGGLSYAFTVPYEYLRLFLDLEIKVLPEQVPDTKKLAGQS